MHGDSVEARVGGLGVKAELEHRMTECFKHVDERFEAVDKRFEQMDKRFENLLELDLRERRRDMKRGFETIAVSLEKTSRVILFGAFTLAGGFMTGFAAMIALVLSQT